MLFVILKVDEILDLNQILWLFEVDELEVEYDDEVDEVELLKNVFDFELVEILIQLQYEFDD